MEDIFSFVWIGVMILLTIIGGNFKPKQQQKQSAKPVTFGKEVQEEAPMSFENYIQELVTPSFGDKLETETGLENIGDEEFLPNEEYETLENTFVDESVLEDEYITSSEMTTNILLKDVEMNSQVVKKKHKRKINLRSAIIYQAVLERPYK